MENWHEKSRDSDLFFCINTLCNVITFRPGPSARNLCPKCYEPGAIVRDKNLLRLGIRS